MYTMALGLLGIVAFVFIVGLAGILLMDGRLVREWWRRRPEGEGGEAPEKEG